MASFRQARKPVLPSSIGGIMMQILDPERTLWTDPLTGTPETPEHAPGFRIKEPVSPDPVWERRPGEPDPGVDPVERARTISSVKAGLVRRPDVTLAGFYQTSLPGFEESFRRSPLFAQQETRLETERAQEEARLKALDTAEERARRQLLRRGGAGGRGGYTRFARREG